MQVTIIGAGIIGLSCAHYLQKAGHRVTVIDSGNLTNGCSFGNMGYISPSHFVPMATPGIIRQGLKWMLSSTSPFYIKPRLNLDLLRWGLAFNRSANKKLLDHNTPHLNNLLQLSKLLTYELRDEFNNSFGLTGGGCWMLYKNEKTGHHEQHLAEQAGKFGLNTIICNAAQVQEYEKEVEVDVKGGVLYLDDSYVDPAKLMQALHQSLLQRGVEFRLQSSVTGFETDNNKITGVIANSEKINSEEVVLANGSWMPETSRLLGIRTLLQPGKGYSFQYTDLKQNLMLPSILVDHRVATTPYDRSLRIGGTMELSGHQDQILPKRVLAIYHAFRKYYPNLSIPAPDTNRAWFGYRPVTPDGMPYIGRHNAFRNLSFAGGHAMLGVSAATGTGKLIAEVLSGQTPAIDIAAFNPKRFG